MRIGHATDIHWFHRPRLRELASKRFLGSVNLFMLGRVHHFDPAVQQALVDTLIDLDLDAMIVTGDLTAQALRPEFEKARHALRPLFDAVPSIVMPGNHDVYTSGSVRSGRMREYFGPWMRLGDDGIGRLSLPGLQVVSLDPNRPHWTASGMVPPNQLAGVGAALAEGPASAFRILALHYPILNRDGEVYDHWEHGLLNARALIDALAAAPRKPDLIIHGHVHHGFRATLDLGDAQVPIANAGSGGYAWLQDKDRSACFNVYEVEDGALEGITRYRFGAEGFTPEPGGAYATGR